MQTPIEEFSIVTKKAVKWGGEIKAVKWSRAWLHFGFLFRVSIFHSAESTSVHPTEEILGKGLS